MAKDYTILKNFLTQTIAVSEALGFPVEPDGEYSDDQNPSLSPHQEDWGARYCFCLMGAVEYTAGMAPEKALGLTAEETTALEAGFCGWHWPENKRNTLYRLGKQIAGRAT